MVRLFSSVVAVLALGVVLAAPAWVACPAPSITAEPEHAAPGESFTVRGDHFGTECDDVSEGDGEPPQGVAGPPMQDVAIRFVQDERSWLLATASADDTYRFEITVEVPPDARPGSATVVAEHEDHGQLGTAAFEVEEDPPPAEDPRGGAEELADTGAPPAVIAGLGIFLLVTGSAAVGRFRHEGHRQLGPANRRWRRAPVSRPR